jgi:hypothetical protein
MEPLVEVLERFRGFQSTDPRDKVYALLALASSSKHVSLPQTDYNKSVAEIFIAIARALVEQEGDLYILHFVWFPHMYHEKGRPESSLDIPSWVPNWTVAADRELLQHFGSGASGKRRIEGPDKLTSAYPKANRKKGVMTLWRDIADVGANKTSIRVHREEAAAPSVNVEINPHMLRVNGICWDTIAQVSEPMTQRDLDSKEWISVMKGWEPNYLHAEPDAPTTRELLRNFWYTLMMGNVFMPKEGSREACEEACDMYNEQYLVLTGRKDEKDVKNPLFLQWLEDMSIEEALDMFAMQIKRFLKGWSFCVTKKGYGGMVPGYTAVGDEICVLFGSDAPVLMRARSEDRKYFSVVGVAYISGIMSGEVVEELEKKQVETQTFHLV